MSDYAVVPYTNSSEPYQQYIDGVTLFRTDNAVFRTCQTLSNTVEMRVVIERSVSGATTYYAPLYAVSINTSFDQSKRIIIVSYGIQYTVDRTIITDRPAFFRNETNGFYWESAFGYSSSNYPGISPGDVPVYDTHEEAVTALTGAPIVNPGVHVEFHPVYIPSFPGVHVQFNPVLSDSNAQGGTSVPGGGDGTFDETSDAILIPGLPSISTVDTGLVTLFRPSQQEVAALGAYLWTHLNDFWENLQKLFTNPMDYFVAFNIFPVVPEVLLSRSVYIGNWGTTITMPPVANQWYEFDCGTVTLQKYWGSALDYAPNTKVQLMLPYIGSVQLNTDEVMGNQIGVKYRIDLLSGSCVALVTVNGNVLYQFTGECAVSVPLTGADWSRIYSAVVGAVGTAVTGVAAGIASGAAAGAATSAVASKNVAKAAHEAGYLARSMSEIPKGVRGAPAMRQALQDAAQISVDAARDAATASGNVSNGIRTSRILGAINNTVGQVMGGKANVSHSGSISGAAGMLGVRDAYLIVEFPNQSLAQDYKHFVGYPSNMYARLGTLSGYTEVEQVIPEGIWGTDDELAELIDALKGGVYL